MKKTDQSEEIKSHLALLIPSIQTAITTHETPQELKEWAATFLTQFANITMPDCTVEIKAQRCPQDEEEESKDEGTFTKRMNKMAKSFDEFLEDQGSDARSQI